jgi:glycosyltransferase involved in cell wall biosynthesis
MQILEGEFINEGAGRKSEGGTEIMANRVLSLGKEYGKELLQDFQIVVSRVEEELEDDKIRILYLHDLPEDSNKHLAEGGWRSWHKLVFVSNWQMQLFINVYNIPWSRCIVLQNAIDPFEPKCLENKWNNIDKIRLIYHPTPHRGLEILVPVFDKLCERYDNLELDVYSSWKLYGWGERDKQYEQLFKACEDHEKINYHASQPNNVVRDALEKAHIFPYPSLWPETSCLCLMEAMSAGCMCIHSNYGALAETAANWTDQYHYTEDRDEHARLFYTVLANGIEDIKSLPPDLTYKKLMTQKNYADIFYSWKPNREMQWKALLGMLKTQITDRSLEQPKNEEVFSYSMG